MKTKQIFRTLCLVAVMCMVSANALAYDIQNPGYGIINVDPVHQPCKILVVEEDATVSNCHIAGGGVLIIKEGKTVTVTRNFDCYESTIYVYGTLNIEQTQNHGISRSTVYIMQGGSLVGSYDGGLNTISTNVAPAAVGSFVKVDAQVPTLANSFDGWPDYYQQRIYSTDSTDFYPIAYYEDAAHTQPIVDLDAWKTNYSNPYHAAYDAGQSRGDSIGYARGKEEGYTEGYVAGDTIGYARGYDAGQLKGDAAGYARAKDELPTDSEGTAGTAVIITKNEKTLKLINPDKIKYVKQD